MRLDRFITLHVVRHWLAAFRGSQRVLPVLMYHSISDRDEGKVRDYYKVCTAPAQFREQMRYLKENGYTGVDLGTGLAWLHSEGVRLAEGVNNTTAASGIARPVVITFDDGFQDFHAEALPILRKTGFTATMYLATAFIGIHRRSFKGHPCMTWSEVKEARSAGMVFGSHTVNHPKLHGMPWSAIASELKESREAIEDHLGEPVGDFAYPYAFPEMDRPFCSRFRDVVREAGYDTCVTTVIGRLQASDDLISLRRLPMNGADDPALLEAKLTGAYDWLAMAQTAIKRGKALTQVLASRRQPLSG